MSPFSVFIIYFYNMFRLAFESFFAYSSPFLSALSSFALPTSPQHRFPRHSPPKKIY